jgi:hypothetical protein
MDLREFQRVVLRLGNQMFVRHFLWLNYPNGPQLMGIQFINNPTGKPRGKELTCACGECKTCTHREYMRKYRPVVEQDGRLMNELRALGFEYNEGLKTWTIQRKDAK